MRLQAFILLLPLLTSCDDVSSNRKKGAASTQSATPTAATIYSGAFREKGEVPLSYKQEIALNGQNSIIHSIPDMRIDDEGNSLSVQMQTRPLNECGTDSTLTFKAKILDCATKNTTSATWDGSANARSAEGIWKLVTRNSAGKETWLDEKTGMIWSDVIATENWCKASGSSLAADDVVGTDCAGLGEGTSICTDLNSNDNPKVHWRLPTRQDYLQADLDGMRFVLKKGTGNFWTATAVATTDKKTQAWTYLFPTGALVAEPMTDTRNIRCIGTPNF